MTTLTLSEAVERTIDEVANGEDQGHNRAFSEAVPFGHDPRRCEACIDAVRVDQPERRRRRPRSWDELLRRYSGGLVL